MGTGRRGRPAKLSVRQTLGSRTSRPTMESQVPAPTGLSESGPSEPGVEPRSHGAAAPGTVTEASLREHRKRRETGGEGGGESKGSGRRGVEQGRSPEGSRGQERSRGTRALRTRDPREHLPGILAECSTNRLTNQRRAPGGANARPVEKQQTKKDLKFKKTFSSESSCYIHIHVFLTETTMISDSEADTGFPA